MTLWNHKMTQKCISKIVFHRNFCFFFLLLLLKNNIISLQNLQKMDYIITGIEWDLYILKYFCDHIGRHLGFLSSPSVMPIYSGSFRNYKHYQTFCYITQLVLRGRSGFPNFWSWLSPYHCPISVIYFDVHVSDFLWSLADWVIKPVCDPNIELYVLRSNKHVSSMLYKYLTSSGESLGVVLTLYRFVAPFYSHFMSSSLRLFSPL